MKGVTVKLGVEKTRGLYKYICDYFYLIVKYKCLIKTRILNFLLSGAGVVYV